MLRHHTQKPGYSCIRDIRGYFASLKNPIADNELVIIGDRIFTDVVLANRMHSRDRVSHNADENVNVELDVAKRSAPLAVLTERIWQKEATLMRFIEKKLANLVTRWARPGQILTERQKIQVTRQHR